MKKVLILGANPETVSLIKKAQENGLYTIVTDNNPKAYAKKYADKAENIDATDVEGLVKLAVDEKVDGILVGVAEALLPAYCEVCSRLNKPCYSNRDQFDLLIRKDIFKMKCREYGVPTIKEYSLNNEEEIEYPVIVKPVDSCSSKGIRVCNSYDELKENVVFALNYSKSKKYLIEEYMTGDEVISYYVMQDGAPIFVGMCDRYTYKPKENLVQLPTCYIFPSKHIEEYKNNTDSAITEMIKGLGLKNGSIFFQGFIDENGTTRVYEPGYRLNGAQEHILISRLSNIDAKEMYINLALTGKVSENDLKPLSNPCPDKMSCKLSPLVKLGKISSITGLEKIKSLPDVISVNPSYDEGMEVTGEGTLKQIIARFYIISDNKQKLIDTINLIYKYLDVRDENGESMLIGEFDTSIIESYNHY